MQMSGYPEEQPGEGRGSARIGVFGVQPRGCRSTGLCGVGALARTDKKKEKGQRPLITPRKSCLKPERGSPAGVRPSPHTPPAAGPARPRTNAQRPSS